MAETPPSVSVVVCAYTRRRWPELREAVASVLGQLRPGDEVIVVCDHNEALADTVHDAFGAAVAVLPNAEARGLSGARNTGVARALGDVVAFLDDDALPEPDWLARLLAPFADASVLGVGGWAVPRYETAPPPWFPEEFLWTVGCSYVGLRRDAGPIRNPIGANMAFRRTAFRAAGPFTHGIGRIGRTPLGCEETEFAIRAGRAVPGTVVWSVPDAVVGHLVPDDRLTWRYFSRRCWAEGLSKAAVSKLVGAGDALASERGYATRTLPLGVARGLARGRPSQAGAIVAGLAITSAGYLRGRAGRLKP